MIKIADGANASPQTVSLTGTGGVPVAVTPASLTFAAQTLLRDLPLLFLTALHLLFTTHVASSSKAPILLFAGVQF
jgi:hypothetical protein